MSVGLDIGSRSIKIVELADEGGLRLKGSGILGYNGSPIEYLKGDKEYASLADAVRRLHKEARISGTDVIVALPEAQVFTRSVKFPQLTDSEIASAVKWEAEQYIPIPVSEAIVQYSIVERRDEATPPEVVVLLIAAPRVLVEKYTKIIELAKLNTVAVETELLALVRALAPENQTVLLVDFGAKSTDIAIAKNGNLVFSRSIQTAGEALTRAVSQGLGIEYQQAEQYKKTYGLSGSQLEGKVRGALGPVFRIVTDEIKKTIQFYQTEEKGETPKSVILSGGTAGMPETISSVTKELGVEVVIGNPFTKIAIDAQVLSALTPYAPLYSIAVGLAMRKEG